MSQVVAITRSLVDAGLTAGAIAHWWSTPRAELDGRSPRQAVVADGDSRRRVTELAQRDAAEIAA